MRRIFIAGVPAAIAVAAAAALLAGGSAADQPGGAPLTKDQYREASFPFFNQEAKSNRLYYKLAIDPLPRSRCAATARRYRAILAQMVGDARTITPPPEIADLHAQLISRGAHIVRGVGHQAKMAQHGKVVCGEEVARPIRNNIADRIYDGYRRSRFEAPLDRLYDLGYLPGGE